METTLDWALCTFEGATAEELPLTLGAALALYLHTVTPRKKGRQQEVRRVKDWQRHPLADRPLTTLRGADFARYRDQRLEQGLSPTTVRLELALVSHLYTVAAQDWGYEDIKNPIKTMRKPRAARGRDRRLYDDEEADLLDAANIVSPRIKPIIAFALETAMRRGEIVSLRWADVNTRKQTALLRDTKNGENRTVPLSSRAVAILRSLPADDERVFPVTGDWISHRFADVCRLAGLEDLRFHDLRHEATSRLVELGTLSIPEVARITGHKQLQMLNRYLHLTAAHLVAKLG